MPTILVIACIMLASLTASLAEASQSPPNHKSAWQITKNLATKANGGTPLALKPDKSYVRGRYFPPKRQYYINVIVRPCPASHINEELVFVAEASKKRICGDSAEWHTWSISKNPIGIKEIRRRIKSMLKNAQSAALTSAGCTRRVTTGKRIGTFRVVHRNCPKVPLAKELYFSANEVILKWSCVGQAATSYKKVVLHDPFPEPGAQMRARWSIVKTCNGAETKQKLRPAQASKLAPPAPSNPVVSNQPAQEPPLSQPDQPILPAADATAPSAPEIVSADHGPMEEPFVILLWNSSTDNVAVDRYYIYRDDVKIGTVTHQPSATQTFTDHAVLWGNTYIYSARAVDTSGNESPLSPSIIITLRSD